MGQKILSIAGSGAEIATPARRALADRRLLAFQTKNGKYPRAPPFGQAQPKRKLGEPSPGGVCRRENSEKQLVKAFKEGVGLRQCLCVKSIERFQRKTASSTFDKSRLKR
uniref:Uncharacterized protein n=1 Tax=Trichuris muris TaxID=70415 RepID=A0A5S6Q631_TRIMR